MLLEQMTFPPAASRCSPFSGCLPPPLSFLLFFPYLFSTLSLLFVTTFGAELAALYGHLGAFWLSL